MSSSKCVEYINNKNIIGYKIYPIYTNKDKDKDNDYFVIDSELMKGTIKSKIKKDKKILNIQNI